MQAYRDILKASVKASKPAAESVPNTATAETESSASPFPTTAAGDEAEDDSCWETKPFGVLCIQRHPAESLTHRPATLIFVRCFLGTHPVVHFATSMFRCTVSKLAKMVGIA